MSRTEAGTTTRYGFSGPGDNPSFTTDSFNAVTQTTMGLVGGVMLSRATTDTWSYPNIHGDVMATANALGINAGPTVNYDPDGQSTTIPDNSPSNFDYGWLGAHQRPTEHATGSITTIEMGARPYVPSLGRFLSVDPIAGGCENDYVYVTDPMNDADLNGQMGEGQRKRYTDGKCRDLKRALLETAKKLKARYDALVTNPLNLPLRGPTMTVESHQNEFRVQQGRIKNLIRQWNFGRCGGDGRGGTLSSQILRWPNANVPGPNLSNHFQIIWPTHPMTL